MVLCALKSCGMGMWALGGCSMGVDMSGVPRISLVWIGVRWYVGMGGYGIKNWAAYGMFRDAG